jgi:DNA-binding transcriptional MerR regulator
MRIKEAMSRARLTRKAVEYYEAKGLIHPAVSEENGYRDYSEEDLAKLKEIAVLRACGLSVEETQAVMEAPARAAALQKARHLLELKQLADARAQERLAQLASDYDIDRAFEALDAQEDPLPIRERLARAFPGGFGLFLSLHFGRFLEEPLSGPVQRRAYRAILDYLDGVPLHLSPELNRFLIEWARDSGDIPALERALHRETQALLEDPDAYLEAHRAALESYSAYLRSPDYAGSPAARLRQCLADFQRASGYQEVFLANMKRLSPAYSAYCTRLEAADAVLVRKFPEAENRRQSAPRG